MSSLGFSSAPAATCSKVVADPIIRTPLNVCFVIGGGTVSALVGFGLPWLFKNFGSDPALGSGPICTIIQGVSSLLIYFVLLGARLI
jgi:Mg/Co/Ni transporter MgtE